MKLFITCPKGLELLLEDELAALGAQEIKQKVAGVACEGELELAYRICLWSRLANRVLLPLVEADVRQPMNCTQWLTKLTGLSTCDHRGLSLSTSTAAQRRSTTPISVR